MLHLIKSIQIYINKAKFAKVMLSRFGKCLDGLKSRINYEKQFWLLERESHKT